MKNISFLFAFTFLFASNMANAQDNQTLINPGSGVKHKPGYSAKTNNTSAAPAGKSEGDAISNPNGSKYTNQPATAPDAAAATSNLPDAALAPGADAVPAPSTEGMSPGRAAKAKYMHENGKMVAQSARAESKLEKQKAAIAKSRASLESKKKKGKISAADYEAGMTKVKAAEEQVKYLETMLGDAKSKAM